jgi:hypothetical protein
VDGVEGDDHPALRMKGDHALVVGQPPGRVGLHQAGNHGARLRELVLEIGDPTLDDEGAKILSTREVAKRRGLDPDAGGWGTGLLNFFQRRRHAPRGERHRQDRGAAVLAVFLKDDRHRGRGQPAGTVPELPRIEIRRAAPVGATGGKSHRQDGGRADHSSRHLGFSRRRPGGTEELGLRAPSSLDITARSG